MKTSVWFWLLLVTVGSFWGMTLDMQPYLSPDDFGKDLYPFWLTSKGGRPARDFHWIYGPLTPLYYAFWFLVGGVHLISARIGLAVNYLLTSIFAYRTLRLFTSPVIAFLGGAAFLIQEFYYPYYNYNHVGTIPFLFVGIEALWRFFLKQEIRWAYWGTLALAGMTLVKINVGFTSFLAFWVSLGIHALTQKSFHIKHLFFLPAIFGLLTLGGYGAMYAGLSLTQLDHTLYLRQSYREFPEWTAWTHLKHLILWYLVWDRKRLLWAALFGILGVLGLLGLKKRGLSSTEKKVFPWVFGSLFLIGLFNAQDYFILGHIYRMDFWTFPLLVLLGGFLGEWAKPLFSARGRLLGGLAIFLGLLWLPLTYVKSAFAARVPERYLDFPHGRVYVTREVLSTVETIRKGTHYLLDHTTPDQEILTLPREPLYCFLAGRRHAVWQSDFELRVSLREWEEENYIREIEAKQVPLVIFSNRDGSNPKAGAGGFGHFGKTHCRKLAQYVFEHYEPVESFGVWEAENPRAFHAIKVLKRKP